MGTILFSLITAMCPAGVDVATKDQCVYRYEYGELTAQQCIIEQVNLIALYQSKGITSLRLAECRKESEALID